MSMTLEVEASSVLEHDSNTERTVSYSNPTKGKEDRKYITKVLIGITGYFLSGMY